MMKAQHSGLRVAQQFFEPCELLGVYSSGAAVNTDKPYSVHDRNPGVDSCGACDTVPHKKGIIVVPGNVVHGPWEAADKRIVVSVRCFISRSADKVSGVNNTVVCLPVQSPDRVDGFGRVDVPYDLSIRPYMRIRQMQKS